MTRKGKVKVKRKVKDAVEESHGARDTFCEKKERKSASDTKSNDNINRAYSGGHGCGS